MSHFSRRRFIQSSIAGGFLLPKFQSVAKAAPLKLDIPTRMVFLGMGFGVSAKGWFPSEKQKGSNYDLPKLLKPLEKHKDDFSFVQNMSLLGPTPRTAAHSGSLYFLSDAAAVKDVSINIALPSVDQIAAEVIGKDTRFPSLVLAGSGIKGVRGGHGAGLRSLSWNAEGRHMSGTIGALSLYKRLYGEKAVSSGALQEQLRQKKSVLDSLVYEMRSLNNKLSPGDRVVLDQYTTSLREIELQLRRSYEWTTRKSDLPTIEAPSANISGIEEIKLTYDLIVLAFQGDLTRIASYMLPTETMLADFNAKTAAHDMSHFRSAEGVRVAQERDRTHATLLSYFFDKMKETMQADGQSLFDHSMISFGSVLKSRHTRSNGPMIFAGYGGGGIKQGLNVINPPGKTPLSNLWFSMLHHVDPTRTSFTSSENTVSEIFT